MQVLKQIVETYGLHQHSDGVWWLLQQTENLNALGLPERQCPFRIKSNLMMCSHKFDLNTHSNDVRFQQARVEMLMGRSTMLNFFDPAYMPDKRILYVETDDIKDYQAITFMQAMLNPNVSVANGASMVKDYSEQVVRRLRSSNLSTYFIYNINNSHLSLITDVVTAASMHRGRLVLAGPRLPLGNMSQMMTIIPFDKDAASLVTEVGEATMRQIGCIRLKRFMRK